MNTFVEGEDVSNSIFNTDSEQCENVHRSCNYYNALRFSPFLEMANCIPLLLFAVLCNLPLRDNTLIRNTL